MAKIDFGGTVEEVIMRDEFPLEKAREILGFPPEWHLRIALSFGYPADETVLTATPQKGGRNAFEDVVHWERWKH